MKEGTQMMTVTERFMIEEFDVRYRDVCKLKISLTHYPEFANLTSVKDFTPEMKIKYIRIMRFVDQVVVAQRAAQAGLIPFIDFQDESFEVPEYISRAYLATITATAV